MRRPSASPMIDAMGAESREIRLVLVIDLDAEPINGSLTTADGRSRAFLGWIGLAATLNAISEAAAEDT